MKKGSAWAKSRRDKRKRDGLCGQCGKAVPTRGLTCESCLKKSSLWQEENAARIRERVKVEQWARSLVANAIRSSRVRGLGVVEITPEWVEAKFAEQSGRCALTGVRLVPSVRKWNLFQPSLDRIETKLGYLMSNVLVVSWGANAARGSASMVEFNAWLASVRGQDA